MEKIFYNGKIITMDDHNKEVEAVFVKDGIISAVGNLDDINKLKTKDTILEDLDGNVMFPGFIEPHIHLDLAAIIDHANYIGGIKYENTQDVLDDIKRVVDTTPDGQWIFFYGLDFLINRDLVRFDRQYLDSITTKHPVFVVIQSMHTLYANSLALELIGINKDTEDTRDGHCFKDEFNEPTGILTEQTFAMMFISKWLASTNVPMENFFINKAKDIARVGVTTAWTAGMMPLIKDHNQFVYDLVTKDSFPIRHDYAITYTNFANNSESLDRLIEDHPKSKFTGVKFWLDGSPYTGNMKLFENYLDNEIMQDRLYVPANQNGELLFEEETLYELIKEYHNKGVQISVHTQGDHAGKVIVDIFERVLNEYPRDDHRHRLEHCAFLLEEDAKRCAKLGIELSYHVNHLYYYGEALNDLVVGEERTKRVVNPKWALDAGAIISLHTDDPMYPSNPLRLVCTATTRTSRAGHVYGEEYKIPVHDAMKAITINAAHQLMREKEIGSIEIGKYADFTVIGQNPYEIDPIKIGDIPVIKTYLDGKEVKL